MQPTSESCSLKTVKGARFSMSQRMQVLSPDPVRILELSTNLQHDKYPSCFCSSLCGLCFEYSPRPSGIVQIAHVLSSPPDATSACDGAKAHVMTQLDRSGIACTFVCRNAFHTITLPSAAALTRQLPSAAPQSIAYTLPWCPRS
eukprot:554902-Amorphochlora_amoeboformis.AAC.2